MERSLVRIVERSGLTEFQLFVSTADGAVVDCDRTVSAEKGAGSDRRVGSSRREFALWCGSKPVVFNALLMSMDHHGMDLHRPIGRMRLPGDADVDVPWSPLEITSHDGTPTVPDLVASRLLVPRERGRLVAESVTGGSNHTGYSSFVGVYLLARLAEAIDGRGAGQIVMDYVRWLGVEGIHFGAEAQDTVRSGLRGLFLMPTSTNRRLPLLSDVAPIMAVDDPAVYGGYGSAGGLARALAEVAARHDVQGELDRSAAVGEQPAYHRGFTTNRGRRWFGARAPEPGLGHVGWNNAVWAYVDPATCLAIGLVSQLLADPALLRNTRHEIIAAAYEELGR